MFTVITKISSFEVSEFGLSDVWYSCDSTDNEITATLPGVDTSVGRVLVFKAINWSEGVDVAPASGDTIESGTSALSATADNAILILVNDGSEWKILYSNDYTGPA